MSMAGELDDIAERPHPPSSTSTGYYLALLFGVAPIWSMTPLSWSWLLYAAATGRLFTHTVISIIAVSEVLFSIYYYYLTLVISGRSPLGHGDIQLQQSAFQRVLKAGLANFSPDSHLVDNDEETLDTDRPGSPDEDITQLDADDPRALDFRNSFRNWFGKVPFSAIRAHHVYAWLYSSIFNAPLPPSDRLPAAHSVVLDEALDLLQKRTGRKFGGGTDHSIRPICLAVDNVNVRHRPLAFYAAVAVANWCTRSWMERQWGVKFGRYQDLEYLIRIPQGWSPSSEKRPIVFMHGLGLGLVQYVIFLFHLLDAFQDRPLLVPIPPYISQNVFHPRYLRPMPSWELTVTLSGLLSDLDWVHDETRGAEEHEIEVLLAPQKAQALGRGVTMVSHSNGSYAHAWMLKRHPGMISRSCFVDPVTFCSWEGDTCYNFLYKPCTTGFEVLMRYFVGTELGIAYLLQRNFDWTANALWYEDIPNARDPSRALFIVGGKDGIVHAERVRRYLRSHGVRKGLWYDPEGRHGQPLIIGGRGHTKIMRWLQEPER